MIRVPLVSNVRRVSRTSPFATKVGQENVTEIICVMGTDFFLGCGRGGGRGRGGGVALSLVGVLAAVGSDIVDRGGGGGGGRAGQVRDLRGGGGGRGVEAVAADAIPGVPVVVLSDVQRDLRTLLIID